MNKANGYETNDNGCIGSDNRANIMVSIKSESRSVDTKEINKNIVADKIFNSPKKRVCYCEKGFNKFYEVKAMHASEQQNKFNNK